MRFVNYFHIHTNIYYRTGKMNFYHIYVYFAGISQVFTYGKLYGQIYINGVNEFDMKTDYGKSYYMTVCQLKG